MDNSEAHQDGKSERERDVNGKIIGARALFREIPPGN